MLEFIESLEDNVLKEDLCKYLLNFDVGDVSDSFLLFDFVIFLFWEDNLGEVIVIFIILIILIVCKFNKFSIVVY